jgi:hypothetical protein
VLRAVQRDEQNPDTATSINQTLQTLNSLLGAADDHSQQPTLQQAPSSPPPLPPPAAATQVGQLCCFLLQLVATSFAASICKQPVS